jgi:hypothetical protein
LKRTRLPSPQAADELGKYLSDELEDCDDRAVPGIEGESVDVDSQWWLIRLSIRSGSSEDGALPYAELIRGERGTSASSSSNVASLPQIKDDGSITSDTSRSRLKFKALGLAMLAALTSSLKSASSSMYLPFTAQI